MTLSCPRQLSFLLPPTPTIYPTHSHSLHVCLHMLPSTAALLSSSAPFLFQVCMYFISPQSRFVRHASSCQSFAVLSYCGMAWCGTVGALRALWRCSTRIGMTHGIVYGGDVFGSGKRTERTCKYVSSRNVVVRGVFGYT